MSKDTTFVGDAPSERALDLVRLAGHCGYHLRVIETERGYNLSLIDTSGLVEAEMLTNTDGEALTYASAEEAEQDVDDRLIELAEEHFRDHGGRSR